MTRKTTRTRNASDSRYRHMMANRPHPLQSLDSLAVFSSYHRGQEICGQGRPAEYGYLLLSGAAKRYVIRAEGRRQIVDLLLPGAFCGFIADDEQNCAVAAIVEGTILAGYPRRYVEMLAVTDPNVAREICNIAFEVLSRQQTQLLTMGCITALEKVSSFILEMMTRLPHGPGDSFELPVSRYDIAEYLAVSVETVSRCLSDLKQRGVIQFSGARTITVLDRNALEDGKQFHFAACHTDREACSGGGEGQEHASQGSRGAERLP